MMQDPNRLIGKYIPSDHSRQTNAQQLVRSILEQCPHIDAVLDLGCGDGNSADLFAQWRPGIRWVGVDIEYSPEVAQRSRKDLEFHTFDGVRLPFKDSSFDLIYSNQVLEHVRRPEELLTSVCRVLKPGGLLVGSTSHLEPFHSLSYWNFTPYGFAVLATDAGLEVQEIRPSIDALTLIVRRLMRMPSFFNRWWRHESPLNKLISARGRMKSSVSEVNSAKLLFCGQFSFVCRKVESSHARAGESPRREMAAPVSTGSAADYSATQ